VSSPAEHETFVDHATSLPTNTVRPERAFEGQRFVRHEASRAAFSPWRQAGFEMRDLEIATATRGLAGACVVRTNGASVAGAHTAKSELRLSFVLAGTGTLERVSEPAERIERGDAFCVPAGMSYGLAGCSGGFEMLEVSVPGSDA
jgi:mannose-6-phosphate isomerase-like protein (cupin superfamily)